MILIILALVVLIFLFISIVNYFYQAEKYKYSPAQELKELSFFESPSTWRICIILSAILFAVTFVLCAKYVMSGFSFMDKQETSTKQYNEQMDSNYETTNGENTNN